MMKRILNIILMTIMVAILWRNNKISDVVGKPDGAPCEIAETPETAHHKNSPHPYRPVHSHNGKYIYPEITVWPWCFTFGKPLYGSFNEFMCEDKCHFVCDEVGLITHSNSSYKTTVTAAWRPGSRRDYHSIYFTGVVVLATCCWAQLAFRQVRLCPPLPPPKPEPSTTTAINTTAFPTTPDHTTTIKNTTTTSTTPTTTTTTARKCPDGYHPESGLEGRGGHFTCYTPRSMDKTSFVNAREECMRNGSEIVTIKSKEEMDYIKDELASSEKYWVGIICESCNRSTAMWVDGGLVSETIRNVTNLHWRAGSPQVGCTFLNRDTLETDDCLRPKNYYICQLECNIDGWCHGSSTSFNNLTTSSHDSTAAN